MSPVLTGLTRRAASVAVALSLAFAYEVYAVFFAEHGVTRTDGARPLWVGEIAGDTGLSQTFGVTASGLYEVAFQAAPYRDAVKGQAVVEVSDVVEGGASRQILRNDVPASELVRRPWYRVRFPPIDDSGTRVFRLDVRLPDAPPGAGLSVAATRDNAYRAGMLRIGGRERWEDLVFTTRATRATMFGNLKTLWRGWPSIVGLAVFWVAFAAYNAALAFFVFQAVERTDSGLSG